MDGARLTVSRTARHRRANPCTKSAEDAVIGPHSSCDHGHHIRLGAGAFLKFSASSLKGVDVTTGTRTRFGARGTELCYAAATTHSRDTSASRLEFGRVHRQRGLDRRRRWPDLVIGDGVVIGKASVVIAIGVTVAQIRHRQGEMSRLNLCDFHPRLLWKAHVCAAHHKD
jgi:hypothetical protein